MGDRIIYGLEATGNRSVAPKEPVMISTTSLGALTPVVVLLIVLLTDIWVYLDANAHLARGEPVVATIGSFSLDSPAVWCVVCLVLWILVFPLYVVARGKSQ
jgi:hypothetical protein